MRWVLLAFLTLLAAFASVAVALRTKPAGRTELALTSCIVWNAIIGAPIYALGLTHHLSATPLALLSAAFSTSVLVGASWRGSIGRSVREVASGVVLIVTLPFEGLAIATRARSVVTLALALVAFLIVYLGIASYFTPSWRQWDALWYHEPIIGFTIQNHGFSPVDLPPDLHHLIARQLQVIADARGVAAHEGEQGFLPAGEALAVVAGDDGFVADVIGDVGEVDIGALGFGVG